MNEILSWFARGGAVMIALGCLAMFLGFLVIERFWATEAKIRALRSGEEAGRLLMEGADLTALRRLALIRACIIAAPLLGLLGTVSGMIETFQSIMTGGYIREMSRGISKALLTTQYGLAIAAPGLLVERVLLRRAERLAGLARAARGARREER